MFVNLYRSKLLKLELHEQAGELLLELETRWPEGAGMGADVGSRSG